MVKQRRNGKVSIRIQDNLNLQLNSKRISTTQEEKTLCHGKKRS